MVSAKILVVEDDTAILKLIVRFLTQKNYLLQAAINGQSALEIFYNFNPDLVILDINLPDMLGYHLCEQMQRSTNVYVLMLTCRTHPKDKEEGFRRGADDYLTKPFNLDELEWRIKALLKRRATVIPELSDTLIFEDLVIDSNRREIKISNQLIKVTPLEFELLYFLASHRDRVWSRAELMEKIWKLSFTGKCQIVDVHIGQIRKKIKALSVNTSFIKTVRGVGYKFEYLNNKNES